MSEFTEEQKRAYLALAHAIQTGVAHSLGHGSNEASPKHLRTGLNMVMVDVGALIALLVEAGVFTAAEFAEKQQELLEAEKAKYEEQLSEMLGSRVTLG